MRTSLAIALVRINTRPGQLQMNLEHVLTLTAKAAGRGAQFVMFPELALTGHNQGLLDPRLIELALTLEDGPTQQLPAAARAHRIHLAVGFMERRQSPGVVYNSVVTCDPTGRVLGTYAKSHLFVTEKLHFRAGARLEVYRAGGMTVGPMICMDIGYPEVASVLSLQGAQLLDAPSAWITEDEDLWKLQLWARALDNLMFVAGANRVGTEADLRFISRSILVDPRVRKNAHRARCLARPDHLRRILDDLARQSFTNA